jgi:recombination protein RecA
MAKKKAIETVQEAMAGAENNAEKRKALEKAIEEVKKQFGDGALMRLGESSCQAVEVIPTGSLALDLAIGVGGIPRGRVTEIFGPESSGKTTLCQHIVAQAQKAKGMCAYIDMEHALDPVYAAKCGVNTDELYIAQPDTGEQALEIAETLVRSGGVDVVVIDSVAALVPRAEIEGDMGDATMGMQARLMSQALRKLSAAIRQTNTAVIFTNQLRQKIGVFFGNPETTTGGMALKFYASLRLDVRRKEPVKNGAEVIGNHVRVKVVKNKVAPPFREAEFDILFEEGISRESDLLGIGEKMGVIEKRGNYLSFAEERIGHGQEGSRRTLKEKPDLADRIEAAIREKAKTECAATAVLESEGTDEEQPAEGAMEEEAVPEATA